MTPLLRNLGFNKGNLDCKQNLKKKFSKSKKQAPKKRPFLGSVFLSWGAWGGGGKQKLGGEGQNLGGGGGSQNFFRLRRAH